MVAVAVFVLAVQCALLGLFSFFAFFNYLYAVASLFKPRLPKGSVSGERIAVVIVSFNERYVLEETIKACEALTYPNKLIVLADDSSDPLIVEQVRRLAMAKGCKESTEHRFVHEIRDGEQAYRLEPVEIWESSDFVLLHRPTNAGFKAGSLKVAHEYLDSCGVKLMYLLDADWHPQPDALERSLETLEADDFTAFVQTKRVSPREGMRRFQKYVALAEEGCYHVDLEGRQVLGHPILFSGCCTLFRLNAVSEVGGFRPGHLTEDLDLTNRLWLAGWKTIYAGHIVNHGEVPFTYEDFRRQQERWTSGSARSLRDYFWPIVSARHWGWMWKLSALRQNAYFTTTLLTGFGILLGMATVAWIVAAWNSYTVEYYLYLLGHIKSPFQILLYLCILSNFAEPLITILCKRRKPGELLHLPMTVWYSWSVLFTYVVGNVKGLFGIKLDWFRTPKFIRSHAQPKSRVPLPVRSVNSLVFAGFLWLYTSEGWLFGWYDEFVLLLLPAFLLAAISR